MMKKFSYIAVVWMNSCDALIHFLDFLHRSTTSGCALTSGCGANSWDAWRGGRLKRRSVRELS
jgi:hypothetical protein